MTGAHDVIDGSGTESRRLRLPSRQSPAGTKKRSGGKGRNGKRSSPRRSNDAHRSGGNRERETGTKNKGPDAAFVVTEAISTVATTSPYSLSTNRLAKVLFKRVHCSSKFVDLTLKCSRFTAKYRSPENAYSVGNNQSIENGNVNELGSYPSKQKLVSSTDDNKIKLENVDSDKINEYLMKMGFESNNDKMYTMQPSEIYCYSKNNIDFNNISYSKLESSIDFSCGNLFMKNRSYKKVPFKLSPESKHINNNADENTDYCAVKSSPQTNGCINTENKTSSPWYGSKKKTHKYWLKRHMLFSKFDFGILLDEESFYSVCPEILSYHIAKRCANDIALDPFCGAGGNIIQLAFTCKLVLAIDIDPNKVKLAKHNAEIYGVADKIEFIVGDFFTISSMLKADVIYMSPPWGGPEYSDDKSFNIASMCKNKYRGGFDIFETVKKIAPNIAFHMPKTTNIYDCLWLANDFGGVEIEQNVINGKMNSITAFYGKFTELTNNDYRK